MATTDHAQCGRGTAEDGPDDPDCVHRSGVLQAECARAGCGFCRVAEKRMSNVIPESALSKEGEREWHVVDHPFSREHIAVAVTARGLERTMQFRHIRIPVLGTGDGPFGGLPEVSPVDYAMEMAVRRVPGAHYGLMAAMVAESE